MCLTSSGARHASGSVARQLARQEQPTTGCAHWLGAARSTQLHAHGGYGNGGYGNGSSIAQQNGYRDGVNDGRKDRATGHSFRPTQGDNYKGAPGYSSSMGDRQQYKDAYRQSYQQGYQQGYR